MNKLKLIIKREFISKVRNKTFLVMTILSPLIVIAMGALIAYLTKLNQENIKVIAYVDQSELFLDSDFEDAESIHYLDLSSDGSE